MMMKKIRLVCFMSMANVTPHFLGEVGVTLAMAKGQLSLQTMITEGSHMG